MIEDKRLLWPLFIIMVLAQLGAPSWMIYNKKKIAKEGSSYRFELEALDPNDPFRGKYIILNPKNDTFRAIREYAGISGIMYATFQNDSLGFAEVKDLSVTKPKTDNYLSVRTHRVFHSDSTASIHIDYPFDRYYMNEHKALDAEKVIQAIVSDSTKVAYVEIKINKGDHVIEAVKIDGIPIETYLEENF